MGRKPLLLQRRDGPHRLSLRHAQQHAGRFEKITAFCRELARCLWPWYGRQGPDFGTAITMGARVVTVFGGPAFSAAASFDISASTNSPFGSHQGIRSAVADCSDPMIRNFNISQMVVLPVRIELTSAAAPSCALPRSLASYRSADRPLLRHRRRSRRPAQDQLLLRTRYSEGLAAYRARNWDEARRA
jgi:hypothetical protein